LLCPDFAHNEFCLLHNTGLQAAGVDLMPIIAGVVEEEPLSPQAPVLNRTPEQQEG
jgi:hypothetical protein